MSDNESLKQAALQYAACGFAVFPLRPGSKRPRSKSHGFYDATTDLSQIEAWWTENPDYNIGMPVGNGIIAIDLDVNHGNSGIDGGRTFEEYTVTHGEFPKTAVCRSPRGGRHLYYRVNEAVKSHIDVTSGIDIGAKGHYMVLPPSVNEFGQYKWEGPSIIDGIADADDTVMEFLAAQGGKKKKSSPFQPRSNYDPAEYPDIIPEGGRHRFLLSQLGTMINAGLSEERIRERIYELNQKRCSPPQSDEELEDNILEALSRYGQEESDMNQEEQTSYISKSDMMEKITELNVFQNPKYRNMSDISLSKAFADCLKNVCRFNTTAREWYCYDGIKWCKDEGHVVIEKLGKEFAQALNACAVLIDDDTDRDFMVKRVKKLSSRNARNAMIDDARSEYAIDNSCLDQDNYLFNCLNCVYDARDDRILKHDPDLLLSKVARVNYDPTAVSHDFIKCIHEVLQGDESLINYLQILLGSAIVGENRHEEAYLIYGRTSRNGKSTILDTIRELFGDYAVNIQPDTLAIKNRNAGGPSGDIARLEGARFVQMPEPPKSMKLDASLLKAMTGGDVITARRMFEAENEFKPVFKLFINTNYLPHVLDDTLFASGRLKVIPFERQFKPEERDISLKGRLMRPENLSGILNWLIEGCRKAKQPGAFTPPEKVRNATEEYRCSSDKIQNFLEDCLIEDSGTTLAAKDVYQEYAKWCTVSGYGVENKMTFFDDLRKKHLMHERGTIHGVSVRNVVKGYAFKAPVMPF